MMRGRWPAVGAAAGLVALALAGFHGRAGDTGGDLRAWPLSATPFWTIGLATLRSGRPDAVPASRPLLVEAVRRDPHALPPRLALLALAAQEGNLAEVGDQLAAVARLDGEAADDLVHRLAARVSDGRQAADLARITGGQPALAGTALGQLATLDRQADLVPPFVDALPPAAWRDGLLRGHAAVALAAAGAFAQARKVGVGQAGPGLVQSPDFAVLSAPPPFAWHLSADPAGVAERGEPHGLMLSAYGRASGVLAQQLLTLGPGRWRVVLVYEPRSGSAALVLRLRCANGGQDLGARALDGTRRQVDLVVAVPATACGGQWLDLAAQPGEAGQPQQALALHIDVQGAGR